MTFPLDSRTYPSDPSMPSGPPHGYAKPAEPPALSRQPAFTEAEILAKRGQFYELIIRQVLKALTGFIPGAGLATDLLSKWGLDLENILGGPGLGSGTVDPIAWATHFVENILSPTGLLGGAMDWLQLGLSLFGLNGLDEEGFGAAAAKVRELLGDPNLSEDFNLVEAGINMLRNVLTPAGALTTQTQLPAHLFGWLAPGNTTNLLPDGGFDNPNSLAGNLLWDHDFTVGHTSPLGTARTNANGTIKRLIGVPIGAHAGGSIELETWARWTGLTATGDAIAVCAQAYDRNGKIIAGSYQTVAWVNSPPASSFSYTGAPAQQPPIPAHDNGWVHLKGTYECPIGVAFVRLCLEVRSTATAGTVWFDDCGLMTAQGTGIFDAGWLGNWGGLGEGIIPGEKMSGIQGIANMLLSHQSSLDGLFNAWTGDDPVSDVPLGNIFGQAQQMAVNAFQALVMGFSNSTILSNKVNKQVTTAGLQPSGEGNFTPAAWGGGTTTLATGNAMSGWVRIGQDADKGFIDLYMAKGVGASNVFVNLYDGDPSTGDRTKLWGSSDVAAVVPETTPGWAQVLIPGNVSVVSDEVVWVEVVNASGANMTVATKNMGIANHPFTTPVNYGATRVLASTGGNSPATIANSAMTHSATAPMLNFGIAEVPPDYHLPELWTKNVAGLYTYLIPEFAQIAGATFDVTVLGAGGGGQANYGALIWFKGGNAGEFRTRRLVYGVDLPLGATSFTIYVGVRGAKAGMYWTDGDPGEASYLQYEHPTLGTQTLTAPGGAGGGDPGTAGYTGKTPGSIMDTGNQLRFGGGEVGGNQTGNPPGGGGGGAGPYQVGADGAPGGAWVLASMP